LIWKLSHLFEQNWFGIDDFLLNFFAIFGSVLDCRLLQVNTGLQPPTHWRHLLQAQCCVALSQLKKGSNWQSSAW